MMEHEIRIFYVRDDLDPDTCWEARKGTSLPPKCYREVESFRSEGGDLDLCEIMFELFQERPLLRSMAVGDKVAIDDRHYICAPTGFKRV